MQQKFYCVGLINKSWRPWRISQITTTYLIWFCGGSRSTLYKNFITCLQLCIYELWGQEHVAHYAPFNLGFPPHFGCTQIEYCSLPNKQHQQLDQSHTWSPRRIVFICKYTTLWTQFAYQCIYRRHLIMMQNLMARLLGIVCQHVLFPIMSPHVSL